MPVKCSKLLFSDMCCLYVKSYKPLPEVTHIYLQLVHSKVCSVQWVDSILVLLSCYGWGDSGSEDISTPSLNLQNLVDC